MLQLAGKFPQVAALGDPSLERMSDGMAFGLMLLDGNTCNLSVEELEQGRSKWIGRVSNLKKLLLKMGDVLEERKEKTDPIAEIDVVEIAKHHSPDHLARFFEVVVTLLMGGPHKQRYVTMIMALPQDIQNTFFHLIDAP